MPDVTPEDIARAEALFVEMDAVEPDDEALIEDPGPNPVALTRAQALEIVSRGLAEARAAGGSQEPPSDLEEQLAACQAAHQAQQPWVRAGRHLGLSMQALLQLVVQEQQAAQAAKAAAYDQALAQRQAQDQVVEGVAQEGGDGQ